MTEAFKRDFILQFISIMEENAALITEQGFDPAAKIEELKLLAKTAEEKETLQQNLQAKAKNATVASKEALKEAYNKTSATVELMTGFLGKDNNLIKQIRLMRK